MARHVALLMTDIVDSTALAERLGDARMASVWAAHDEVVHALLNAHQGQVLDRSDGVTVAFEEAHRAASFGLAYVDALRSLPVPLAARVGIHVGLLIERVNDPAHVMLGAKAIESDGVVKHVASRVASVAGGGQVLVTADAAKALAEADGLPQPRSHGHWRFKGVEEPVELLQLAAIADAPPPDTAKAYRVVRRGDIWLPRREIKHSLPAERDVFVGRRMALDTVARVIRGGTRLITMTGSGGAGKTRLAQRFGWSWLGDFEGGVWFCDLSQARTLEGVLHATAAGLDIALGGGDVVAQIGAAIAARGTCLVILDNFEQVVEHAQATVACWLDRAADAAFLVTTRELLHLPGEQAIDVDPLPIDEGAALFLHRANAATSNFIAGVEDVQAIDPLVQLLDGLPLAIELAAARVRVMPPRLLLQRMSQRFNLLAVPSRRLQRQSTLRATLDWSWDLLSDAERAALARLSVFEGDFDEAAARSVLAIESRNAALSTLDLLQSLVDKSLVRSSLAGRFVLLTSIQEYAREALRSPGRFAAAGPEFERDALELHQMHFADDAGDELLDVENIVIACRRAIDAGRPSIAARTLHRSWTALRQRGPFTVGRELASRCMELPGMTVADRIAILKVRGAVELACGSLTQSREHYSAGLQLAAGSEPALRAPLLTALAEVETQLGLLAEAEDHRTEALVTARREGDALLECALLNNLASAREITGNVAEARSAYEAALQMARRAGNRRHEGATLGNLGQCLATLGLNGEARSYYRQALAISQQLGDREREGNTLCNLGLLDHDDRQFAAAREHLAAALAISLDLGHVRLGAIVRCNLGLVCESLCELAAARAHHEEAVAIARGLSDQRLLGQFLGCLGECAGSGGDYTYARDCLVAAERSSQDAGDAVNVGIVLCRRAVVEHAAGQRAVSHTYYERAMAASELLDLPSNPELGAALSRCDRLHAEAGG